MHTILSKTGFFFSFQRLCIIFGLRFSDLKVNLRSAARNPILNFLLRLKIEWSSIAQMHRCICESMNNTLMVYFLLKLNFSQFSTLGILTRWFTDTCVPASEMECSCSIIGVRGKKLVVRVGSAVKRLDICSVQVLYFQFNTTFFLCVYFHVGVCSKTNM